MTDIRTIQQALKELGIYEGNVDGISGMMTDLAIKRFQSLHPPLQVDGIAGKQTLKELLPDTWRPGQNKQDHLTLKYGEVGTNQVYLQLPYPMKLAWDTSTTLQRFQCHRLVVDRLQNIFANVLEFYGLERIQELGLDLFGGCLNVRKQRGGDSYSLHAWGIAVDLNPAENQLRWTAQKARFAQPEYGAFWRIVKGNGFYSLGLARDYDYMHFQAEPV